MKRMIFIGALCAISASAFAQSAPSDPATNLSQDFQAYSVAQKHVIEDMQALVQETQQQKKQIDTGSPDLNGSFEKSRTECRAQPGEYDNLVMAQKYQKYGQSAKTLHGKHSSVRCIWFK